MIQGSPETPCRVPPTRDIEMKVDRAPVASLCKTARCACSSPGQRCGSSVWVVILVFAFLGSLISHIISP